MHSSPGFQNPETFLGVQSFRIFALQSVECTNSEIEEKAVDDLLYCWAVFSLLLIFQCLTFSDRYDSADRNDSVAGMIQLAGMTQLTGMIRLQV